MNLLANLLLESVEYREILDSIKNYKSPLQVTGPSDSQKAHICHALLSQLGEKGIYIAHNEMQARRMVEDFSMFFGDEVLFFPEKEIILYDVEAKSYDAVFQRIKTLDRMLSGDYSLIVTSAEAVSQRLIGREVFSGSILAIEAGETMELDKLPSKLFAMGYERVSSVEGMGQFSVRGGILDIYPIHMETGVRVEFFDDEVDSIRAFDPNTQRSVDRLEKVRIIPAREIIYPAEEKEEIVKGIGRALEEYIGKIKKKSGNEHVLKLKARILGDIEKLKNEHYFPGIDRLLPFITRQDFSIMDYFPDGSRNIVFIDEHIRIKQRIENVLLEFGEACRAMLEKGGILPQTFQLYQSFEAFDKSLENEKTVYLNTMPAASEKTGRFKSIGILSRSMNSYQGHMELLFDDIRTRKEKGDRIVVLSGTRGRGQRLKEELLEKGIEAVFSDSWTGSLAAGTVLLTPGSLSKGFEYPSIGLAVISDREAFGQGRKTRKSAEKKEGSRIKAFTDLNQGDFVVHQAHGIGQYVGISQLMVENVKRDYLKIKYKDGGFIYIPVNQMDLIQKYIGSEGKAPKLSKLGGTDWLKTKNRVRESLKELAAELIKLYAQRKSIKGFSFSPDTVWQKEFEEAFPYEETNDQLKCIEEIKKDMESDRPMDRLLCGDVGYGKTEVAIRAIFKAAMDGKQVAYLVPTTVLAQQHYNNFLERMREFPVTVDVISRFRTPNEQKRIVKEVKAGKIDVLIGTHRLIQKDIQFKDLGLLVVDEEQRFGVTHKEKLKNLKANVDTLTLTATPIPRTLHMSLVGIRDISTLEDPPEERYPVQTYVMEHDGDVLRDAITREMSRNGQVFYLYNRVRSIQLKAAELQTLLPEARIEIAHGQMAEGELEKKMNNFMKGEYDILVCTTIIESGLDLPNVNTIIVEDADRMGLAQLYQIRGRVGRSNRLAYAYITFKKDKVLSEVAEKRLQAIKEFTEFGSGFKIAMRDLEIRGAGNLLGQEQHGHMETVGYEMYCKLLDEAVRELSGESYSQRDIEVTIDINTSAYIDTGYIGSEASKIEMYKRIASIQDEQDVLDVEDELIDRYGDLPEPVRNLLKVALIKAIAKDCGFSLIQEKEATVIFQYVNDSYVSLPALGALMEKHRRNLLFTASSTPYITYRTSGINKSELLDNIKLLLQQVKDLQSGK